MTALLEFFGRPRIRIPIPVPIPIPIRIHRKDNDEIIDRLIQTENMVSN